MKKADYSKIASFYDKGRTLSEQNIDLWLGIITRLSRAGPGARWLDLGCGTGRFAIPLAVKFGYRVTGADNSPDMLDRAREKDNGHRVAWDLQNAQDLSFPDGAFDVVFMSHLLHHCEEPIRVIRECRRVLSPDGALINRYGAIEQVRGDVEHTFFPGVTEIDEARVYSVDRMEGLLKENGFSEIVSEEIIQQTFPNGRAHLKAASVKNTSVLTMISESAFQQGLRNFRNYLETHQNDPWLLHDRMTITAGYKR